MLLKELLRLAVTLFPDKVATLEEIEKNIAASKDKDEDLAYANAILAQKIHSNDANKPHIENILNILKLCAKTKITPPTSSIRLLAEINSLNKAGLFESKPEIYTTLHQEAFNYIKDKKQPIAAQSVKTNATPKPVIDTPKTASKPAATTGNFLTDLKSALNRKPQSTTGTTPAAPTPKFTIPSLPKHSEKAPVAKPAALPSKTSQPQTKSDTDEKIKNLETQLAATQKKLTEQHNVLLLLQNNLKDEERKRREAEAKLEKPQGKYTFTEAEFNNLLQPYIDSISQDKLFDLLFSIAARDLKKENKPFIFRYVTRLYEDYKDINQKMLFGTDTKPGDNYSVEFNEELFKDLSSRYQDALHPKLKNPDFTEEQRKTHRICLSFFILVMQRMESIQNDQSPLRQLSNNPFTNIAKRHKEEIVKQVEKNCVELIEKTQEINLAISKLSEQNQQSNQTLFSATTKSTPVTTARVESVVADMGTGTGQTPTSNSITTMLMRSIGLR